MFKYSEERRESFFVDNKEYTLVLKVGQDDDPKWLHKGSYLGPTKLYVKCFEFSDVEWEYQVGEIILSSEEDLPETDAFEKVSLLANALISDYQGWTSKQTERLLEDYKIINTYEK